MYLIAEEDWTPYVPNSTMPWSAEIDDFLSDFGGYHPYFAVIGQSNILYYSDWVVSGAINTVSEAVESFSQMGIYNPIGNQILDTNETITIDISDLFIHPYGELITMSILSNSDPEIVDAQIIDTELTLTANINTGMSNIEIMGQEDTLYCIYEFSVQVVDPTSHSIVIIDKDETPLGEELQNSILNFYTQGSVMLTDSIEEFPLGSNVDAVFVLLGIYNNNYELTGPDGQILADYLDTGGNLYMEGGDTWYFDDQTSVHPYFHITGTTDGSGDLSMVTGQGFLAGMNWTYSGENSWIDQLEPGFHAVPIFTNSTAGYNCGIAYDAGSYKTVGTSFEITGLGGNNSIDDAVEGILNFFDVLSGSNATNDILLKAELKGNFPNPFNPETTISFSTIESNEITDISIFNIKGQLVKSLVTEIMPAGEHSVIWNGKDDTENTISSGVYFYKMRSGKFVSIKKMILMK